MEARRSVGRIGCRCACGGDGALLEGGGDREVGKVIFCCLLYIGSGKTGKSFGHIMFEGSGQGAGGGP